MFVRYNFLSSISTLDEILNNHQAKNYVNTRKNKINIYVV